MWPLVPFDNIDLDIPVFFRDIAYLGKYFLFRRDSSSHSHAVNGIVIFKLHLCLVVLFLSHVSAFRNSLDETGGQLSGDSNYYLYTSCSPGGQASIEFLRHLKIATY